MPINIENNQITILSPVTLKKVGSIKISTAKDVNATLQIAQQYNGWSSLSIKQRCVIIN